MAGEINFIKTLHKSEVIVKTDRRGKGNATTI